jgi:hypothetical protein
MGSSITIEELYHRIQKLETENRELREILNNKLKDEKILIKTELRDELRKELATKEDIYILDKKIDTEIKLLKRDLIIVIIIMSIVGPEIFNFISMFK